MSDYAATAAIIYTVEVAVDWIKYAFITKFNKKSVDVYYHFSVIFSKDITSYRSMQIR